MPVTRSTEMCTIRPAGGLSIGGNFTPSPRNLGASSCSSSGCAALGDPRGPVEHGIVVEADRVASRAPRRSARTRWSRSMLRIFWPAPRWATRRSSPSRPTQITVTCGDPSGFKRDQVAVDAGVDGRRKIGMQLHDRHRRREIGPPGSAAPSRMLDAGQLSARVRRAPARSPAVLPSCPAPSGR